MKRRKNRAAAKITEQNHEPILFRPQLWLLAALVFGASVFFPFIALDDAKHIWQNPYVMTLSWPNLKFFWLAPYYGLFIPVIYNAWSFLAFLTQALGLKHEISGLSAFFFHSAVVATHLANIALCMRLFQTWLGRNNQIFLFILALPFALHPLQTEVVAWASGLKDTLSASLVLLAMLSFTGALLPRDQNLPLFFRQIPFLKFLGFSFLALMAKPVAVVMPFALLAWVFLFHPTLIKKSLLVLFPVILLSIWVIWTTKASQPDGRLEFVLLSSQKPHLAWATLGFYLSKLILPFPLAPDYGLSPPRLLSAPMVAAYDVLTLLFVMTGGFSLYRTLKTASRPSRLSSLGFSWVLLGFGPVLGLVSFEFQNLSTVADRYFYLFPALGFGLMLLSLVMHFFVNQKHSKPFAIGLAVVWAILSLWQTSFWASNERLFQHTAEVNPGSYLSFNNLGLQAVRANDFTIAEDYFKKALAAKSDYLAAVANLGVVYFKRQDYPATVQYYQKALLTLPPAKAGSPANYADMYFNLGAAQLNLQETEGGIQSLRQAVIVNPDHFLARFHLGRALKAVGQRDQAFVEFQHALRLQPQDARVLSELNQLQSQ